MNFLDNGTKAAFEETNSSDGTELGVRGHAVEERGSGQQGGRQLERLGPLFGLLLRQISGQFFLLN